MVKNLIFFLFLFPLNCLAQYSISGRVLNQADTRPLANVSVFLSNATIGAKTAGDGTFVLHGVKPGKYDLVVSIIGFESYGQTIIIGNRDVLLPDVTLLPKTTALKEVIVKYHADPDREKYLNWFKDEFLGTSDFARQCKILNPGVLDLSYDEDTHKLTASSSDFLQIENDALGYQLKYMVADFILENIDENHKTINYKGAVLFEELKGTPAEERRWQKRRLETYQNSPMHFLRAAISRRLSEEGFRVQKVIADKPSKKPERTITLKEEDLIRITDEPGVYALAGDTDGLFVAYNSNRHYHVKNALNYLDNPGNNETTFLKFNSPYPLFYRNGVTANPYSLTYFGVWGRDRVAELLPIDYEPPQSADMPDDKAGNISGKLETFNANHFDEKAYLHFDKPYYAAGDSMYFKAYVTTGEKHELSNQSRVLHVDLINTNAKIDQSIKLQLDSGIAWGDFALPDSLPKGDYRVRAYTQWMLNEGDGNYFDRTVSIGSASINRVPESGGSRLNTPLAKADLQFFPEGGNLVSGLRTKVAFKAIGSNGLGVDVKGEIVDDQNQIITTFSPAHLGMGYFTFEPEEGKSYKARLTYADGEKSTADLPAAAAKGIVLSINNDSIPKATVTIIANKAYYLENQGKYYSLVIYSGGIATTVPCELDSAVITLDILKRRLQTGVASVTLFSPEGEPLCERLFFVQNYDQLNVQVNSDKAVYAKKEKVNIKLNVKTRADKASIGHFSVSVTDESKVPVDENDEQTILTDLLLTSDLKGYVEQPNYYFRNITDKKASSDLDLVMLTHGFRRFEWKKLLNDGYPPVTNQPEKGIEIAGIARNAFGKPLVNGTVTLIPANGGPLLMQQTDDKGNFNFSNLAFTDSAKFVLQAANAKGKNSTTIVYNKEKSGSAIIPVRALQSDTLNRPKAVYLENSLKQHDQAVQDGRASGLMLKEVKVRQSKKHIIDTNYRSSSLLGPGHADQVMRRKELEQIGGQLSTSLDGRLRGVYFAGQSGHKVAYLTAGSGPMAVFVDGVKQQDERAGNKTTPFSIDNINPDMIETVEVLKYGSASIYGLDGGNGVLVITTRQGGQDPQDIQAVGILPITVAGFYKAREFYSPKYDHPNDSLKRADLRSTIFWKPEIVTDKDGNASFDYYNADGAGIYRVVVEGIDNNGNLGRQVYRYKVE